MKISSDAQATSAHSRLGQEHDCAPSTIAELYSHLREFRIPKGVEGDATKNSFRKVTEVELRAAENEMGIEIPAQLRAFYKEVGNGHIVVSANGVSNIDYFNIIIDLGRMVKFWNRTEVSFDYDPDIVDEGEMSPLLVLNDFIAKCNLFCMDPRILILFLCREV